MSGVDRFQALNEFESALRAAVRRDVEAEMTEEWQPHKLKKCHEAWAKVREKRTILEELIG